MKIAITGNIGSGKSTFSNFAEDAGFVVLKADDISKQILENDDKVRKLVIKEFGEQSFINQKPNKTFLAREIFSNPDKLKKLENILHPRVIKKINNYLKDIKQKNKIVFVEAALIYEADLESLFDYVVLITAERNIRLQRKVNSGLSEEDFVRREENQIPEDEKKKRADFIFSNNSTVEELKIKFKLLLITFSLGSNN
jgi:dephospho-CoA kinase